MKNVPVLVMLLVNLSLSARGIGDFVPLATGNVWVYDYRSIHKGIEQTSYDSSTLTIRLLKSYTKNDTVFYCFSNNITGMVVSDTISDEKPADTRYVDRIVLDTLYEVNDTLRNNYLDQFGPIFFQTHLIDTFPTFTNNPLVLKDGKYECRYSFQDNASNTLYQYVYRQDVGLTSYQWSQMIHMDQQNRTFTLRTFNGGEIAGLQNLLHHVNTVQHGVSPAKRLNIPCLLVVNGAQTFNLLGRTERRMVTRSLPQYYRKNVKQDF